MFELEKEITAWRNEMYRRGIKRAEVLDELENHLREDFKRRLLPGELERNAFAQATAQLGGSEILKREFSKVARDRWMIWACIPADLNVLAIWFIIAGINASYLLAQTWRFGVGTASALVTGWLLILSCQIFIGLGMLYRVKVARYCALSWAGFSLGLFIFWRVFILVSGSHYGPPASSLGIAVIAGTPQQLNYIFLGISLPFFFLKIISYLNLALLLCACFFLTRPATRRLFGEHLEYV